MHDSQPSTVCQLLLASIWWFRGLGEAPSGDLDLPWVGPWRQRGALNQRWRNMIRLNIDYSQQYSHYHNIPRVSHVNHEVERLFCWQALPLARGVVPSPHLSPCQAMLEWQILTKNMFATAASMFLFCCKHWSMTLTMQAKPPVHGCGTVDGQAILHQFVTIGNRW